MKLLLGVLAVFLMVPTAVSADVKDNNDNKKYDCSVTKKPGKIDWVKKSKKDVLGDGVLDLKWEDSFKAHKVEIRINGKKVKTGDDGRKDFTGLTGEQKVKIRGISNCGKGKWTKTYRFLP